MPPVGIRLRSGPSEKSASARSPRRAFGTVIVASTSCCTATSIISGPIGSIETRVFNYGGKLRAGG